MPCKTAKMANHDTAGDVILQNHLRTSGKPSLEFEKALRELCGLIKKHQGSGLDLEIKSPTDYKVEDVLEIVEKIAKKHRGEEKIEGFRGKVRRLFLTVGSNKSILDNLISFVPNDSYGSIISGGFTIILGVSQHGRGPRRQ